MLPVLALGALAGLAYLIANGTGSGGDPITVYDDGSAEIPTDLGDPVPIDPADAADSPDAVVIPEADPVSSFLYMLRSCENAVLDVISGAAYQTFYGGSKFSDMSNHPVLTGEKRGVPLPPALCIAAGIASGNCVSTAAGAYQFTVPTWRAYGLERGEVDFSPEAQDRAAVRLLDSLGATDAINRGDIAGAIKLAGSRWASLPGARGGQPQKTLEYALAKFNQAQESQA